MIERARRPSARVAAPDDDVDGGGDRHAPAVQDAVPLHCGACWFATLTMLPKRVATKFSPRSVNAAVVAERDERVAEPVKVVLPAH